MSDDVSTIRTRLTDPRSLCEALGLMDGAQRQPNGGLHIRCPAHGDKGPSCSVTRGEDGTIRVHCFGSCGLDGDALTLIAAAKGLEIKRDFRRVLEEGARLAGVQLDIGHRGKGMSNPGWTSRPPSPPAPKPLPAPPEGFGRIAAALLELCPLAAPSAEPVRAYLSGRGLLEAALADCWGALPLDAGGRAALQASLVERFGEELLIASGLFGKKEMLRLKWASHALVIPFRDVAGALVSLQRRLIVPSTDPKVPAYVHAGVRGAAYGLDRLAVTPADVPIAFVEGALDALALRALGARLSRPLVAVGVQGVDAWSPALAAHARGRVALVASDADPFDKKKNQPGAGDRAAEEWAKDIQEVGAVGVSRLRPVGAKDWAELVEQLAGEPDAGADLWEETPIAVPVEPDPLWGDLARLAEEARARGILPDADSAALATVHQLIAAIEARRPARIEFIDRARIAEPLPLAVYPIQGFCLPAGTVTLLVSFSFGGKTLIAQEALLAVAIGDRAWRHWPTSPGRVVHLDYEQGEHQTRDRYQRLLRGRGFDPRDYSTAPIDIAVHPKTHLWSPGAVEDFKRAFDGASVGLIDTFNAASPGQDENDAQISEGVHRIHRVAEETGCAIIIAHHTNKASLGMGRGGRPNDGRSMARGSGAIFGAVDLCYTIEGPRGEPKLVHQEKSRGLGDPQVEDFYLKLAPVNLHHPDPQTGERSYFNPANPSDPGGFEVVYRTVEQVKPPKSSKDDDLDSDCAVVLEYIRSQNVQGIGVASASACVKPCKMRKADVLDAVKTLKARSLLEERGKRGERTLWLANRIKGA